jgi:DNA-binding response OmpR family regulator
MTPHVDPARPAVLVADDDPHIVELVSYRLERAGYDVIPATDGQEALSLLEQHRPDLAVLDVMMPRLSGYDITRELRRSEPTRNIPVILLTGCAQESDIQLGFEAGADDYLRKPFSPEELRARVQAILGRR